MKIKDESVEAFTQYRRKQIAELRPYQNGEDMIGVSISAEDYKRGSPKPGDMIARNPKNHADQWLVAAAYFAENFEPIDALSPRVVTDEMVEAGKRLKSIVEEVEGAFKHGGWWDENGVRLKDTPEWVAFYNALTAALSSAGEKEDDTGAMTPEEIRLEDLQQMAKYDGPIVSFDFKAPFYLASCDKCGWVGSSELCGTDSFGDDSDVYCPRCFASGADCGKVAEALASPHPTSADKLEVVGYVKEGDYRASGFEYISERSIDVLCVPLVRHSDATRIITACQQEVERLRGSLMEADRFLSHPLDPDDVVCAHDVIRAALEAALPHLSQGAVRVRDASYTEMLIDNAATASQNTALVDDPVTREAIRFNIIDPLLALTSHEPALEPDEEAAREFVLSEFSPLQPEPEKDRPEVVERLRKWSSETINQWPDEYEPRENWERQVSGAMREWGKATTEIISDYEALRAEVMFHRNRVHELEHMVNEEEANHQDTRLRLYNAEARNAELVKVLEWYGEQARLARLIHSEGDSGRHALAEDGGKRARAALNGQAKP